MKTVEGLGQRKLRVWEEDGFVWVAVAPTGRNEYALSLFPDDAMKVAGAITCAAREAAGVTP